MGMTVADLSPFHLYALIVTAIIYAGWIPGWAYWTFRHAAPDDGWTGYQKFVFAFAAFGLWGIPVLLTLFFTFSGQ